MNPQSSSLPPRRRYLRWILAGLAVMTLPFLLVAGLAVSVLTLDRDAAVLRKEVMRASGSSWDTRVQVSAGSVLIGAARAAMCFVDHHDIADARLALAAVRQASVGVYHRERGGDAVSARLLLERADRLMATRGFTRLVGVVDGDQTVLIYASDDTDDGDQVDLCLAVLDERDLVVVSTSVESGPLTSLVEKHLPRDYREKLELARL